MEIEIQGRKTEHVTVTVDQSELVEKTIQLARRHYGLKEGEWIKEGNVMAWEIHYHGSDTQRMVRVATEKDIEGEQLIEGLKKLKWSFVGEP